MTKLPNSRIAGPRDATKEERASKVAIFGEFRGLDRRKAEIEPPAGAGDLDPDPGTSTSSECDHRRAVNGPGKRAEDAIVDAGDDEHEDQPSEP